MPPIRRYRAVPVVTPLSVTLLAVTLLAVTLLASACSSTGPATPPETTTPTKLDVVTDPPELLVIGAEESVRIGSIATFTGPVAFLGEASHAAVELAVRDYGDVQGFTLAIDPVIDDACGQADIGLEVADAVADGVLGFVGTTCRSSDVEVNRVIAAAGSAMVSPSNLAPDLTAADRTTAGANRRPGYYRTVHNAIEEAIVAATYLADAIGAQTAAVVSDRSDFSGSLASVFVDSFRDGDSADDLAFIGAEDAVVVVDQLVASRVEAVFLPLVAADAAVMVGAIRADTRLADVAIIVSDTILQSVSLALPAFDNVAIATVAPLRDDARSATGTTVAEARAELRADGITIDSTFWANAYDAAIMLLSAIDAAAVVDGDVLLVDPATVRQNLDRTDGVAGLTGQLRCDPFGDCAGEPLVVVLHLDGATVAETKANIVFGG